MKTVYRNVVSALLYADLRLGAGALAMGRSIYPLGLSGLSNLAQILSEPGATVLVERKPAAHLMGCTKDDAAMGKTLNSLGRQAMPIPFQNVINSTNREFQ